MTAGDLQEVLAGSGVVIMTMTEETEENHPKINFGNVIFFNPIL